MAKDKKGKKDGAKKAGEQPPVKTGMENRSIIENAYGADYEKQVLARAQRRANRRELDRELSALATLALIRSGISNPQIREERKEDAPPTPEELEARLRHIIDGVDN